LSAKVGLYDGTVVHSRLTGDFSSGKALTEKTPTLPADVTRDDGLSLDLQEVKKLAE